MDIDLTVRRVQGEVQHINVFSLSQLQCVNMSKRKSLSLHLQQYFQHRPIIAEIKKLFSCICV